LLAAWASVTIAAVDSINMRQIKQRDVSSAKYTPFSAIISAYSPHQRNAVITNTAAAAAAASAAAQRACQQHACINTAWSIGCCAATPV